MDIFDAFIEGAVDGFRIVYKIMPTLIGLMITIGVMRESGSLEYLANVLKPVTAMFGFPSELVSLVTVKMFSSSAATSLLLNVNKQFGSCLFCDVRKRDNIFIFFPILGKGDVPALYDDERGTGR